MNLNSQNIKILSNYFRDKPVIKAYLFGSQVRNQITKDSDIDILVELDYSQPIGLKFLTMRIELEELFKRKVDLLSDKAISKYIRPSIEKEKLLIYER